MRIETLEERIKNAKAKIEKKGNTIVKKTALIAKKENKIAKETDENEIRWTEGEIRWLKDDIRRLENEIAETKASLEKYEKQLAGELERESILIYEVPECMKKMQAELVKEWDEYDKRRRERIREAYRTMTYEEFHKRYSYSDYMWTYSTDEQIHKSNEYDARLLILNLYNRIKDITGEVTDWSDIRCEMGNVGAVLTGFVIGKEGRAEVETILAGGYNIQRLHVRTLVHAR